MTAEQLLGLLLLIADMRNQIAAQQARIVELEAQVLDSIADQEP